MTPVDAPWTSKGEVGTVGLDYGFGVLASGFMWAVFWSLISMGLSTDVADAADAAGFVMASAAGQIVCIAASAILSGWIPRAMTSPWLLVAVAAVGTASLGCAYGQDFAASPLMVTMGLLAGGSGGFLWLLMARFLARCPARSIASCLALGSLLGAVFLLVRLLLASDAGQGFSLFLMPLSMLCFWLSERFANPMGDGKAAPLRQKGGDSWAGGWILAWSNLKTYRDLYLVILVFGLVFGVQIASRFALTSLSAVAVAIAFAVPGPVLLVVYYGFRRAINFRTLCLAVLMLTVAALLPWAEGEVALSSWRLLVIYSAYTLFDLSSIATLVEIGDNEVGSCVMPILLGRLATMVSVAAGMVLVMRLGVDGLWALSFNSISILLLVAVFARFTIVRQMLMPVAEPAVQETPGVAIKLLAEDHGLSKREVEVLELVAKGYNAKRIAQEMVVSYNTVKSHLHRIYAKLGVHGQQEVILLVEEKAEEVGTGRASGALSARR